MKLKEILLNNLTDRLGRNYDRKELEQQIIDATFYGQLDRPEGIHTDLDKISHMVSNIRFEEDVLVGDVKVLDTPAGLILQTMLDRGVKLDLSIRATGYIDRNNNAKDIKIFGFDYMSRSA
jgi:hypothetical protein